MRNYHNAGKVQASSEPQDMRLQRMLGHTTTLLSEHPDSIVDRVRCRRDSRCRVDRSASEARDDRRDRAARALDGRQYFGPQNFNVIENPKVEVHIDDARHFHPDDEAEVRRADVGPLDLWVKGAAALYTQEFFEKVKDHLTPGGLVTLFVQLYESNPEAVKSEIATFFKAFPNGFILANTQNGRGYDLVLVGPKDTTRFDVDRIEARLHSPEYAQVAKSLSEVGINSAIELFANFAGQASDMGGYTKDALINHDSNLRLQYLAGLGLNLYQSDPIYQDIVTYAGRFPDNHSPAGPRRSGPGKPSASSREDRDYKRVV